MNMDLIQHFINACDSVLAQTLGSSIRMDNVSMDQDVYHSKGVAASIVLSGDVEGRVVLDVDPETAVRLATTLYGIEKPESEEQVRETIGELANQVIGNAVATLNDEGFHFKVHPPDTSFGQGTAITEDTEALLMRFDTGNGPVFLNIAVRYGHKQHAKSASA